MKTLNLHCPINTTSYGYVSSYFLKGLSENGYNVRHVPISHNQPDPEIASEISHLLDKPFDRNAPSLKIWHQNDLHTVCGRSTSIGFPIFELEEFSSLEAHSMGYPDFLFVCSNWARDVASRVRCSDDIFVTPLGYDDRIFKPAPLPNNDVTVFGNFGKFEKRKGHDVLIEAFNRAFSKNDDVMLLMMPSNPFLTQEEINAWISLYKRSPLFDKVGFVGRQPSQKMVYNIMSMVHCGVFPARAEGWNLEALELLACGRHLIITDCTGHTEFCNQNNSRLIQMTSGFEKAFDQKFFFGQGSWRKFEEPEMEQLIHHMREVHKMNKDGSLKTNENGVNDSANFTWNKSSSRLANTIRLVTNE